MAMDGVANRQIGVAEQLLERRHQLQTRPHRREMVIGWAAARPDGQQSPQPFNGKFRPPLLP